MIKSKYIDIHGLSFKFKHHELINDILVGIYSNISIIIINHGYKHGHKYKSYLRGNGFKFLESKLPQNKQMQLVCPTKWMTIYHIRDSRLFSKGIN